jgi:hypothetical protein
LLNGEFMEKASPSWDMDQDFRNNPTVRPYFQVARPAHFRFRPDLIEELCVADAMIRTLRLSRGGTLGGSSRLRRMG